MPSGLPQRSHLFWVAFFISICGANSAPAQTCGASKGTLPFADGEQLSYNLVYQWGLLWVPAGRVTFSVKDTLINESVGGFHFQGDGASLETWDWFYKVRSRYASVCDSACNPLKFERSGQEGSYIYDRTYDIYPGDSARFYRNDPSKESMNWPIALGDTCAYDVISAIYRVRSIDFANLNVGDSLPLRLILDGAVHDIHITYAGIKAWKDPRTGKKYRCHLIRPDLIEGTIFKAGDSMKVFVSDDRRKIPLYIETDLVVGKARIFLTGTKNLVSIE